MRTMCRSSASVIYNIFRLEKLGTSLDSGIRDPESAIRDPESIQKFLIKFSYKITVICNI